MKINIKQYAKNLYFVASIQKKNTVGTWQWANATNTVRIILKKENILMPFPENFHMDHGWFSYLQKRKQYH